MKIGRLTITAGAQQGRTLLLSETLSVFEVGKAPGSHIKLSGDDVAMNHCRILRRGEEYWLYALCERCPTTVNGAAVRKVALSSGDRIGVGATELVFELLAPEDASAPPPAPSMAPAEKAEKARGAEPPRAARLVVLDGEARGTVYSLTGKEQFKVGRSSTSDIRLPDAKVSRDHCTIEQVEGHYIVVDLESANGTVVNGERIRKTVLQNNDFVRLGFTLLKFESTPTA